MLAAWLALWMSATLARSEETLVAVATNFQPAAQQLQRAFEAQGGYRLRLVYGSTGKLYAQVRHGAPFHALLAADAARPMRLEQGGLAVPGSRFTYAVGRLVLWSAEPPAAPAPTRGAGPNPASAPDATSPGLAPLNGAAILETAAFRRLALAQPELAPYGWAARQVLERLGVAESLEPRLVYGENVGQAYALAASGNAEWALVAASQVALRPQHTGTVWAVPPSLHDPIVQQAVLLVAGRDQPAARAFMEFLHDDTARALIAAAGYDVP